MRQIQTLIADDTALLRRLLADRLGREGDIRIVAEAGDGREAVDMARLTSPDVAILDLDMPNLNGIQAAQEIVAERPCVGVVLLTAHAHLAMLGVLSGASECLDKACSPHDLAAAVRRAFAAGRGQRQQAPAPPPPPPAAGPSAGDLSASLTAKAERLATRAGFTDREKAVVVRMVTTEMTAAQVARALSAEGSPATEAAVKHTLGRAIQKLGIEPRTRAALIRRVLDT